jgi:hypothetical protein
MPPSSKARRTEKKKKTHTCGDAKEKQVEAEEAAALLLRELVLSGDLLEHVLSFLPTPEGFSRCATVSRAFRAACASRATIHAQLARASLRRRDDHHASTGLLELSACL